MPKKGVLDRGYYFGQGVGQGARLRARSGGGYERR